LGLGVSGILLLANHRAKDGVTRIAAFVVLALGLALVTALTITAAWLAGVYGPVGKGGAGLFGLLAALVAPYFVALPIAEVAWSVPRLPATATPTSTPIES